MGCGAMCGDNVLVSTSNKKSKIAFQKIVEQLQKNSKYSKSQSFVRFHECYVKEPQSFYLKPQDKLIANQQFPQQILIKWKIVLFGQNNNKSSYENCVGLDQQHSISNNQTQTGNFKKDDPLLFHQCFKQIQKDLDRTFTLPQIRKNSFEKVLKKIANYFPKMGYTQGINFMIGYLIIIGYSQEDSFWIFVHIALNRRFLLLGLYEDGFPLVNVLIIIFNNALKRQNQQVYNHLIVELGVDTSQWVFKWFITCYLYSFPRELIKYVWDYLINAGNLGMISFAIALVKELQAKLLEIIEIADISQFFDSMKDIQQFNQNINLRRVIQHAYAFTFTSSDFQDVQNTGGFYGIIVKETFIYQENKNIAVFKKQPIHNQREQQTEKMLTDWYDTILRDRLAFLDKYKESSLIDQSNKETGSMHRLKNNGQDQQQQLQQVQITLQLPQKASKLNSLTTQSSKDSKVTSKKSHLSMDIQQNRIEYVVDDINQNIQEEQNSIRSSITTNKQLKMQQNKQKVINMDELDKFQHQFNRKNGANPLKHANYATKSNINKQIRTKKQKSQNPNNFQGIKINNYAINPANSLSIAGQSVLKVEKNDASFDAISVSSKRGTNKSQKQPSQNTQSPSYMPVSTNNRICSCKQRTEEYKKQIEDQNSQFSQSKDRFSEKDSNKNDLSQHQKSIHQNYSIHNMQSERARKIVDEDYMVNSHGPQILEKKNSVQNLQKNLQKTENEVQLEMITFKKDKRKTQPKISYVQITKAEKIQKNAVISWQNQQQSFESIHNICYDKMSNRTSRRSQTGNNCEVESIR